MDKFRFYEIIIIGAAVGYAIDFAERNKWLKPIYKFFNTNQWCGIGAMFGAFIYWLYILHKSIKN
jgi:hypothetical protein